MEDMISEITYHVVRTIDPDGNLLTHLPVRDRIVSSFDWIRGVNQKGYIDALACAHEIRAIGKGYAIVVTEEDLPLYDPEEIK